MRDPISAESIVFDGPLKPGRCDIAVVLSKLPPKTPPGAGNESMSGLTDPMLVCMSSKLTDGRKSKEFCELSRLPFWMAGAKLSLDDLSVERCLVGKSWGVLGKLFRCTLFWFETLLASLGQSAKRSIQFRTNRFTHRFEGEDCKEPRGSKALCSLKEDCLRRLAGVGNISDLILDDGVGSAGRSGIEALDRPWCNLFEASSSPTTSVNDGY